MVEFSAENKVYRVICMPQTLGELFPKLTPWGYILLLSPETTLLYSTALPVCLRTLLIAS